VCFAGYLRTSFSERQFHRVCSPLSENLAFVSSHLHPRFRFPEMPPLGPGVALALGGGFAHAYSYLGVLGVVQEEQIPISCIAGSSIGGVLGAAYAAGIPLGSIIAKCREIRFRNLAPWRISRPSLASNKHLASLLDRCFDSRQFEDLAIPVTIVSTDLGTGDPVVFKQGLLAQALGASCAFPGLFEPVQIGTRYLADGVLVAPVPTHAARELGAQIVVGVSVGSHDCDRGVPSNIFHVVSRAINAVQKNHQDTWEQHADVVLYPSVQSIAWNDFARIDEAVEAGATASRNALPQIRKLLACQAVSDTQSLENAGSLCSGALQ
jgi:NTE family protein